MDNQKISMPTEAEKQRAIARILDAGLPRRVAFGRELREVLQRIGPRALLFGVGDCLALSLLIWALCLLSALFVAGSTGSLAPALFLFSPLLYAALSLLTAWKNLQTGIWEWTWTFQVSARMVAALQMLCFGGVSVLVCVPANMLLWTFTGQEMPLGWMLALSLASLFLYGALPAVPAAAGTCRVAGGADRLGSDGPDSPDLAPDGGVADGHPHRSVLPAGRGRDYSVPFGTALLLPAPDGRRRLLCSPLSTSRKPMGSSPLWRTFP